MAENMTTTDPTQEFGTYQDEPSEEQLEIYRLLVDLLDWRDTSKIVDRVALGVSLFIDCVALLICIRSKVIKRGGLASLMFYMLICSIISSICAVITLTPNYARSTPACVAVHYILNATGMMAHLAVVCVAVVRFIVVRFPMTIRTSLEGKLTNGALLCSGLLSLITNIGIGFVEYIDNGKGGGNCQPSLERVTQVLYNEIANIILWYIIGTGSVVLFTVLTIRVLKTCDIDSHSRRKEAHVRVAKTLGAFAALYTLITIPVELGKIFSLKTQQEFLNPQGSNLELLRRHVLEEKIISIMDTICLILFSLTFFFVNMGSRMFREEMGAMLKCARAREVTQTTSETSRNNTGSSNTKEISV